MKFIKFVNLLGRLNPEAFIGYESQFDNEDYDKTVYSSVPAQDLVMPRICDLNNGVIRSKDGSINAKVEDLYEYRELTYLNLCTKLKELNENADFACNKMGPLFCDKDLQTLNLPIGFYVKGSQILSNGYNDYFVFIERMLKVNEARNKYNNDPKNKKARY